MEFYHFSCNPLKKVPRLSIFLPFTAYAFKSSQAFNSLHRNGNYKYMYVIEGKIRKKVYENNEVIFYQIWPERIREEMVLR